MKSALVSGRLSSSKNFRKYCSPIVAFDFELDPTGRTASMVTSQFSISQAFRFMSVASRDINPTCLHDTSGFRIAVSISDISSFLCHKESSVSSIISSATNEIIKFLLTFWKCFKNLISLKLFSTPTFTFGGASCL